MGKVVYMTKTGTSTNEQITALNHDYNEVCKKVVLSILEKGEKPTEEYVIKEFEKHMQHYTIDQNSKQDIRADISNIFPPELSADDIKLLANMYEDIGTYQFRHTEFSINFDHTHEANQKLLENTLDAITLILEHKTVRNLTLGASQELLYALSQTDIPTNIHQKAPKIHPIQSRTYTRKEGQKKSYRRAA